MFNTYYKRPVSPSIDQSNEVSLTQQSDMLDCDINRIVNRAMVTGMVDPSLIRQVSNVVDASSAAVGASSFFEAQLKYREGIEAFEALPSSVRNRFNNDISQLLDFVGDPKNRSEAEKMGLLEAIAPVSPEVGTDPSLDITVPTDTEKKSEVS